MSPFNAGPHDWCRFFSAFIAITFWTIAFQGEVTADQPVGPAGGTFKHGSGSASSRAATDHLLASSTLSDLDAGPANVAQIPRVGYDRGFVIESPADAMSGEQQFPFSLRVNSRFQFRHTYFDSQGPNADQNDFEFERLRLVFSGNVYRPELTFFIQFDGDNDEAARADFLDYYVRYDLGRDRFGWNKNQLGIQLGQWKVPFSRSRAESGYKLQFTDRATANVFFDINRSVGIGLFGAVPQTPWMWELAVHNGFKNQGFTGSRSQELDTNIAVSGRTQADLIGDWGKEGEPDLQSHRAPVFRVGAGFAATRADAGTREFNRLRVVDSGKLLATLLPSSTTSYNAALFAADAGFKFRGLSVIGEYYFRTIGDFSGASVADLFDHGFVIQGGYFLLPDSFEIVARYSRIVGNSGSLGARDTSSDETALGANWYIRGHSVKLSFDATYLNGSPAQDSALNIRAGDEGMLYRSQFQLMW